MLWWEKLFLEALTRGPCEQPAYIGPVRIALLLERGWIEARCKVAFGITSAGRSALERAAAGAPTEVH